MKTIYSCIVRDTKLWYGDRLLRIISAILHLIELGLIIYLLVR